MGLNDDFCCLMVWSSGAQEYNRGGGRSHGDISRNVCKGTIVRLLFAAGYTSMIQRHISIII